jgi:hypothetical protein
MFRYSELYIVFLNFCEDQNLIKNLFVLAQQHVHVIKFYNFSPIVDVTG